MMKLRLRLVVSWSLLLVYAHAFWSTCETGTTCVFYCYDKLLPKLYGAGPHLHVNPLCTLYGERTTPQDDVVAGNGRPPIRAQTKDRQDVFYDSVIITNLVPKEHLLKLLEHASENPYKRNGKNLDYRLIYMEAVTIIREISAEFTGAELKFTKYAELDGMIQERLQAAQMNREELMHLSDANSGLKILKVTLSIPRLAEDVENKVRASSKPKKNVFGACVPFVLVLIVIFLMLICSCANAVRTRGSGGGQCESRGRHPARRAHGAGNREPSGVSQSGKESQRLGNTKPGSHREETGERY